MRGYVERAGFAKAGSCHLLRHTAATLMLDGGPDSRFIQALLGHESQETTQIYTQVSIGKLTEIHAATHLLILDDWGLKPLTPQGRHDLLEILEDRYGRKSTLVTSQVPIADWHGLIGYATYADAILDRLVHNAHRIDLTGESLRRNRSKPEAQSQA